jgi:WD40 repeat protein
MWLGSVAQGQVASLGEDDVLRLWDHEHPLEGRPPAGIGWTLHPACHPSGTRAARWDANDAQPDTWAEPDASFWVDLAIALGPNPPWSYVGHSRWPVFFSPEGDLVGFRRGPLTVTDVHTDQLIATLSGWTVCGLAFIPGQRALLRDFDETDLVTGHSSRLMPLERTRSIPAVSSDGRYVAYVVTEQPALAIFDLRTGQQVATLRTPGTTSLVMSIAWSGDGRIACGDLSGTIWVWSGPFDGARPRRFAGHRRHVDRIHLTGDGSWMVSAADDGTARVWDLRAGAEWMTIPARDGPFRGAATDPETATVWTWAANGRVQGWPLHPEKVLRARGIEPLSARELERLTAP